MTLKKCVICGGSKTVYGMGYIKHRCENCAGTGTVEEVPKDAEVLKDGEVPDVKILPHSKPADPVPTVIEKQKKKRGRPPKLYS